MVFSRARITLAALVALLAVGVAPAFGDPSISSPTPGQTVALNGSLTASYSCGLGETFVSALVSPGGQSLPAGGGALSTSTPGGRTLTVTCSLPIDPQPTPASVSYTVLPDTTPPSAPNLQAPVLITNDTTPLFNWSNSSDSGGSGLAGYTLIISGPTSLSIPTAVSQVNNVGPLLGGVYTWRVVASDNAGNTTSSLTRALTIDILGPPAPGLNTPAGGILMNDRTPTFSWDSVTDLFSNPAVYSLRIIGPTPVTTAFSGATTFTPAPTAPLADGSYTWVVTARDTLLNTTDSAGRNFTLDGTPPGPITITAGPPASSTNPNPSFSWTPGEVGASFAWQVVDDNGNVVKNGNTGATTLKVSALPAGLLSFRVWQVDAAGNAGPAAEVKFRINNPPPPSSPLPKPQIRNAKRLKPKAGYEVTTATVTLGWYRPTKDTLLYNVQLFLMSKNGKTLTKVHSAFPRGTTYKVPARTFKNRINRRFVWQVWAYRGQAKGYLSRPIGITYFDKLKTKALPKFLAPTASRLTAGKKQLVRWRKAPKTNYYQVVVYRGDSKIVAKRTTRVRYTIPASRLRPNFTYRIVILRGLGSAKAKARYASKAWTGKKLTVVPPPRKV